MTAARKNPRTRTIGLLVTNRCNLRCAHCLQWNRGALQDMSIDLVKDVLPLARSRAFTHISISGGEPTVYPHILKVVLISSRLGFTYSVNTNGQDLSTLLEMCIAAPPHHVTISLDGPFAPQSRSPRGCGAHRTALRTIGALSKLGVSVHVQRVLIKSAILDMEEFVADAASLGVHRVVFTVALPTPRLAMEGLLPDRKQLLDAKSLCDELRQHYAGRCQVDIHGLLAVDGRRPDESCPALRGEVTGIDWRGNVVLCCQLAGYGSARSESIYDLSDGRLWMALSLLRRRLHHVRRGVRRPALRRLVESYPSACLLCALIVGKCQSDDYPGVFQGRQQGFLSHEALLRRRAAAPSDP